MTAQTAQSDSMQGKICLITGATAGIGKATAAGLAMRGAHLVLIGRSEEKTRQVVEELKRESPGAKIEYLLCDLTSQASIRELAEQVKAKYPRLDVLINNAGGQFYEHRTTVDGYEWTFALDHLAYFQLTVLLLDLLKKSAPARIINVSSGAQAGGHIDFDNLMPNAKQYKPLRAYTQAKLANLIFTFELARKLEGTNVTANCLHPGLVRTNFMETTGGAFRFFGNILMALFGISSEKGAETSIYLASSPEVEGVTGKYFAKCKPVKYNKEADDLAVAKRLWEVSAKLTKTA